MKIRGRVVFAVGAAIACALPSVASAGDQLWWSNYGAGISRLSIDTGTGSNVFVSASPSVRGPYGTAANPASGKVYWVNYNTRTLYSGNLDGSGSPEAVIGSAMGGYPYGLAIDPLNARLFWGQGSTVQQIGTDGTGGGELFGGSSAILGPVVDTEAQRVYWVKASATRAVQYGPTGGGTITTVTVPGSCPYFASQALNAIAVDSRSGVVYMGTSGNPSDGTQTGIAKMNLDGADCTSVAATSQTPSGFALDPDSQRLYWTDENLNALRYVVLGTAGGEQTLSAGAATVSSPAYPVLIKAPAGKASVSPSGTTVGSTLTCAADWSQGLVSASMVRAPQSTSYAWKLDGQTIPGASAGTIVADAAGSYECVATGANAAGSTTATSNAVNVTDPVPPIPPIPPLPPIPTPPNKFTVKTEGANATSLRTRVTVPGPGRLRQRGLRTNGARSSAVTVACTGSRDAKAAGTFTISCRTTAATRRAQARGKVRMVLTTSFTPTGGSTASSSRVVTLPMLRPRYTG